MISSTSEERATILESQIAQECSWKGGIAFREADPLQHAPSEWSGSWTKRCFDVLAVTASLPLVLPALIAIGLGVWLNSGGPVLFVQVRVGRKGDHFRIYKIRTMVGNSGGSRPSVTTIRNQEFTSIGPFLRKWKLDELPQLFNVLRGDMSLVGPRPRMPEHQPGVLLCRPGITGAATLAFGREEVWLARIPRSELDGFMRNVVNPLKNQLDADYMSRASLASDLKLILRSLFRQWPCRASGGAENPGMQTTLHLQYSRQPGTTGELELGNEGD